jgi:hypothetical protein
MYVLTSRSPTGSALDVVHSIGNGCSHGYFWGAQCWVKSCSLGLLATSLAQVGQSLFTVNDAGLDWIGRDTTARIYMEYWSAAAIRTIQIREYSGLDLIRHMATCMQGEKPQGHQKSIPNEQERKRKGRGKADPFHVVVAHSHAPLFRTIDY